MLDSSIPNADKASVVKAANRIRCVRTTEWKYTHYFDALGGYQEEFELYDLRQENALEYINLAYYPAFAHIREEMALLLEQQIKEKLHIHPEPFIEEEYLELWVKPQ